MTTISLSSNATVRTWQSATDNTAVASNLQGVTLKGSEAAAFLFGKALSSLDASFFGAAGQSRITRQQAAFEFPAGSGNRVSLTEVADALRYKFGTDPLIEYSDDLGVTGYSLADINALLGRLNTEYAGRFSFELFTLRTATAALPRLTELDGKSVDLLLSDLMSDVQRQALVDLAKQLRTVMQDWVAQSGGLNDPLAMLIRSAGLADGIALSTTTSTALPGQTVTLTALIQRAGTALGMDLASRFPDVFASGRLHLEDVNLLLAAAREAMPSQAVDLADYLPPQGITRSGAAYTGRAALMLHVADALSATTVPLSGTLPPRIGWNDAVFTDPFAPTGPRLSANGLIARFNTLGFDPFAYLGSPKPGYLTLADINSFFTQLNTELKLSGAAAYSPLVFQFKDDYGNNIRRDEAYLNQVMRALSTASSSAALSGVWSPTYSSQGATPVGNFSSTNAWISGASTINYWAWSGALGAANAATDIGAGLSALGATIPSPQAGVVYLRKVVGGSPADHPSGFGAFTWNGANFTALTMVNGRPVDQANIDAIADGWKAAGQNIDGIEQVAWIPIDRSLPPTSTSWGQQIISRSILGRAWPVYESIAYYSRDPNTSVSGIMFGEPLSQVQGSRDIGYSNFTTFAQMEAAWLAARAAAASDWPPLVVPFYPPTVSGIQYLDSSGMPVTQLVAGQSYKAVVSLSRPWPQTDPLTAGAATPRDRNGFLRNINLAEYARKPGLAADDAQMAARLAAISVSWDAGKASYSATAGYNPSATGSPLSYLWTDVADSNSTRFQATFVAQSSGPAAGTVSVDIPAGVWMRYESNLSYLQDVPLTVENVLRLTGLPVDQLRLVGWNGALPTVPFQGVSLTEAVFLDPRGSNTRLTLEQLSRVLAHDFAGSADLGSDGDGALNLVNWFMGTGASYSGTAQGWPSAYATADQAALAYQTTANANPATFPVVGLGAWNDPSGVKPISEWSVKAGMLSLWWGLNALINLRGNASAGQTPVPALAWAGGFQPVAAGTAQLGVVASAALTAQNLVSSSSISGTTLAAPLQDAQVSAFKAQLVAPNRSEIGPISDDLAEWRRAFKERSGVSIRLVDVGGLDTVARQQLSAAAVAMQCGLLDESLLQRLGFGERVGWDDPVFFDGQGQPASLNVLVGGRSSALGQRLLASMPQLADLGMRFDDLRRILASAASVDSSINSTMFDDPARAPLVVDGVTYQGSSAALLRVAAALRSVPPGRWASVGLDASDRVFEDPIRSGSGAKWSLNDLELLARRSAGYTALVAGHTLYDTDLDQLARQMELVAGRASAISLTSSAVPDEALAWWARQLSLATPAVTLLFSADQALFTGASGTKSIKDLMADAQRLFGCELAPRLEALGILQSGPLRTQVNATALNQFLAWQKARDPLLSTTALVISPAPDASKQTNTVGEYHSAIEPARLAGRELLALKTVVDSWVPLSEGRAAGAPWLAAQQRMAALGLELGSTAQASLGAGFTAQLKSAISSQTAIKDRPAALLAVQSAINTALSSVQSKLDVESTKLGLALADLGPKMGTWTFGLDAPAVIAEQKALLGATENRLTQVAGNWQRLSIGPSGLITPEITATTLDAPPRQLNGVEAAAALLARSLAGLDSATQLALKDNIDLDQAVFTDPAAWGTRAIRTQAGTDDSPKISLRQLAARCQAALGFNLLSDYAPVSGPWTVARVGGLVRLFNDALRCTAALPYASAVSAGSLGTTQGLRDRLMRTVTQELVVPSTLRAPLTAMLGALGQLTASDLTLGGRAALDANGCFDASAVLFKSPASAPAANRSFSDLVAAGSGASPTLESVLSQMGILFDGRASARGLNALIDVMRAESPDTVTVMPLELPPAIAAISAQATTSMDAFATLKRKAGAASSDAVQQLNNWCIDWSLALATTGVSDADWDAVWKPPLQAALDQMTDSGLEFPTPTSPPSPSLREQLQALLAMKASPAHQSATWRGVTNALGALYIVGANPVSLIDTWTQGHVEAFRNAALQFRPDELVERLMLRARSVDLPPGLSTIWYTVAHALTAVDPSTLPVDGSGASQPLFEYPVGSGQRCTIAGLRRQLNVLINDPNVDIFGNLTGDINFGTFNRNDRSRLLAAIYRAIPDMAQVMVDWPQPVVSAADALAVERIASRVGASLKALTQTVTVNPTPVRTEAELRQDISNGADVYINRNGAFFINGVRTRAVDLAVVSRFLVQDSLSAQYKTLMDEMAQRNNIISAARSWVDNVSSVSTTVNASSPLLARAADAVKTTLTTMGAAAWGSGAARDTAISAGNKTALGNTLATWATNTGSTDILYDISGGRWSMSDFNNGSLTWTGGMTAGLLSVMDERIRAENLLAPLWSQNALVTSGDVVGDMTGGRFTSDLAKSNRVRGAERLYTYLSYVAYDAGTLNGTTKAGFATLMQQELTRSGVDVLSEATGGTYAIANWSGSGFGTTDRTSIMNSLAAYINRGVDKPIYQQANFTEITGLLNTLISNKIRDGDLAQSKLQSITGQLQNNIEAISALIKSFNEVTKSMAQALR